MSQPSSIVPAPRKLSLGAIFVSSAALAAAGGGLGWSTHLQSTQNASNSAGFVETDQLETVTQPAEASPAVTLLEVDASAPIGEERVGRLKRNSTLIDTLEGLGADSREAYEALQALYETNLIDPRKAQAGWRVNAVFAPQTYGGSLLGLTLKPDAGRSVIAKRTRAGAFFGAELKVRLKPELRRIEGEIQTSLYDEALKQGAADQQVVDFASVFAYDVDFQREIYPGDKFEIVYEAMVDERGRAVQSGDVVYAALEGGALKKAYYRFTPNDDLQTDYFTKTGKAATRFLMKTPINGARLSSHFGRRRHPISGYTRMHKGTDFAAPTGTPVYAAGHGVVERASRYGGYGNYIRIRHANGYKTAYAHLSRYGRGVRSGRKVRQGQVIGYVGSTGASTGPHLHYEVLKNGKHVNAMRLKLPTGRVLENEALANFDAERRRIDALRRSLGAQFEVIEASADSVSSYETR